MTTGFYPPDWRELCQELVDELHGYASANPHHDSDALVARAALAAEPVADEAMPPRVGHILRLAEIIREVDGNHDKGAAALAEAILSHPRVRSAGLAAEPVVASAGPTDDELLGLDELEESWNAQADAVNSWDELVIDEIIAWAQRQALARWGRPAPPAEGEVGELVAALRRESSAYSLLDSYRRWQLKLTRAADLLEQRHPAPVPVSERLPELRGMFERILCVARSSGQRPVGNIQLADRLISAVVSWSALPLPAGESQP